MLSAVKVGHIAIVDILLQHRGDVNAIDSLTRGIEYYALSSCCLEIIQLFINTNNIDNIVVPYSQSKPIHLIAEVVGDQEAIMGYLLSLGACIYHLNKDGQLPCVIAQQVNNYKIAYMLEQVNI